jgi:hypothetical protein
VSESSGEGQPRKTGSAAKPAQQPSKRKQLVSVRHEAAVTDATDEHVGGSGLFDQRAAVRRVRGEHPTSAQARARPRTDSRFARDFSRVPTYTHPFGSKPFPSATEDVTQLDFAPDHAWLRTEVDESEIPVRVSRVPATELAGSGGSAVLVQRDVAIPMVDHHQIPQVIRNNPAYKAIYQRLQKLGINIHRYIVRIPEQLHRTKIHPGGWNEKIIKWLQDNPNFTKRQLHQKLAEMRKSFGIPKSAWSTRQYGRAKGRAPKTHLRRRAIKEAEKQLLQHGVPKSQARKLAIKMVRKHGAKKVLSVILKGVFLKFIPIIGWAFLLWDVYDIAQMAHAATKKPQPAGGEESEFAKLLRSAKWSQIPADERAALSRAGFQFDLVNMQVTYPQEMIAVGKNKVIVIKNLYLDRGKVKEVSPTPGQLDEMNFTPAQKEAVRTGQAQVLQGTAYLVIQIVGNTNRKGQYVVPLDVMQAVPVARQPARQPTP